MTSALFILSSALCLILRVFGLLNDSPHISTLHRWLLDVGNNVPPIGAAGGVGAGVAGSGGPNPPNDKNPCESESSAVDAAQQLVDSAQNRVDALQQNLSGTTKNLPQQVYATWLAGQQAQGEWALNPTLGGAMGPLEQGLQSAAGDPSSMPTPSAFPPTSALLGNLNQFFASFDVSAAAAAAPLGVWSSGYTDGDPWGSGGVPLATQQFLQSLQTLQADTNLAAELQNQLNDAQAQLENAQKQLQDAKQALSDCASSSAAQ